MNFMRFNRCIFAAFLLGLTSCDRESRADLPDQATALEVPRATEFESRLIQRLEAEKQAEDDIVERIKHSHNLEGPQIQAKNSEPRKIQN